MIKISEGAEHDAGHNGGNHHDQLSHDQFTHAGEDRDYFALYRQHVLAYSRNEVVLDILNHTVVQKNFVECFEPGGLMHSAIMYLQCAI